MSLTFELQLMFLYTTSVFSVSETTCCYRLPLRMLQHCPPVNILQFLRRLPCYLALGFILKGEIRNKFNLISGERVNIFEQNSENFMKSSWQIRKLWHFEVSHIFKKHFLTSRFEYANEWVDNVIASQFSIPFVHRNDKIFIFHLWEC